MKYKVIINEQVAYASIVEAKSEQEARAIAYDENCTLENVIHTTFEDVVVESDS